MMTRLKRILSLVVITLVTATACGKEAPEKNDPSKNIDNSEAYSVFREVFEKIEQEYVSQPEKDKMLENALDGMLGSLDPHSSFLTKEELSNMQEHTTGEFGGIGIEIIKEQGALKVIAPIDDLAGYKAGIKAGDYIIAVDNEPVSELGFLGAVKKMRGKPGSSVHLTIVREERSKPLELDITRETVKIEPVKHNFDSGVGYIRIVDFKEKTINGIKDAIKNFEKNNSSLEGIVLDLRDNPGGLLKQAVEVSNYFVKSGLIVSTRGREESKKFRYLASPYTTKSPELPVVVLINNGSASASEIVAGALQDHNRAVIMGTQSFGKGSVQEIIPVSRGALKLTVSKYYTPNNRDIQAEGINPDISVEQAKVNYDSGKDRSDKLTESKLKNHLKSSDKDKSNMTKKEREKQQMSKMYLEDYQYARAHDLIKSLNIVNKYTEEENKGKKENSRENSQQKNKESSSEQNSEQEQNPTNNDE